MPHQFCLPGISLGAPLLPDSSDSAEQNLRNYPDVPAMTISRHAKSIGAAGEALFDSFMFRIGEMPFSIGDHLPFDRLLWRDSSLIRVQIKTSTRSAGGFYNFSITRGYRGNPGGVRPYGPDDFDMLALVILPENAIYFTVEKTKSHRVPVQLVKHLQAEPRASFDTALADIARLRNSDHSGPAA